LVDIHSHILPGLDDGAQTLDETLAMLRLAAENGTTDIVATPHANSSYAYHSEVVEQLIAEVAAAAGDLIRLHRGCDFHLNFDNLSSALEYPQQYTINAGRYLMWNFRFGVATGDENRAWPIAGGAHSAGDYASRTQWTVVRQFV